MAVASGLAAQRSSVPDSLHRALTDARHDSDRFDAYKALAGELLYSNADSAEACCRAAHALAEHTGRPGDKGEMEGWLGYLAEQRGAIDEALDHYGRSLAETERLNDSTGMSTVLNNLAAIYKDQGRIDLALATHQRSLAIRRARRDSSGIATSLNNVALIKYDQGRIPEALEDFNTALRIYERKGDHDGTATALGNIAAAYRDQGDAQQALHAFGRVVLIRRQMGDDHGLATAEDNIGAVLEQSGDIAGALAHYHTALDLHNKVDDGRGRGYSERNIAGALLALGRPEEALEHAERSLAELEATDDKRGQASALVMIGRALDALHRPREARTKAEEALALARELGFPQQVRDAAGLLASVLGTQGHWREALAMHQLHVAMRDSLQNEEARRSSLRQQFQYAYEKKEAALHAERREQELLAREQLQREKNRRNILLFAGIAVAGLAAGLWARLRHVRSSRTAIRKERDIADGLLLNILPAQVAAELKEKGSAQARLFDPATVLFTDFKGFTAMAEQLSPAELVAEIDACFQGFDAIMARRGVEKIKTIGDAYMCVGGLPDPGSCTPADVVLAALDMQDFMRERAARRRKQGLPVFEMRVGMHTGPVVAGIVGVRKFQYDIWGDTVNTAARMESSGEVGKVNISEATYALVKAAKKVIEEKDVKEVVDGHNTQHATRQPATGPAFLFTPRGKVQAKGKGEMEMYFVERA